MENRIKKIPFNKNPYYITMLLLTFLPRFLLCYLAYPVRIISDEVASVAGGAYLAGYDWSAVVSHAGYYGQGFAIFFAPLFWITDNPFIIYRGMLIICAIAQGLTALISYHCMKKFFSITDEKFLCFASLASSYMVVRRVMMVYNEHPLILISWIVAWLLLVLHEAADHAFQKKRIVSTILLFGIMAYSLTLHTRSWTYWIALGITVLFYFIVYRKWIISIPTAIVGAVFAFMGLFIIQYFQNSIWLTSDGESLRNGSIGITSQLKGLISIENWQAWLDIILGQVNTIMIMSGGMAVICLVLFLPMLFRAIFMRKKFLEEKKNTILLSKFTLLAVYFISCVALTICAQSITWLSGAAAGIMKGYGTQEYGLRAFTYTRYFGSYIGPIFLIGLLYIYLYRDNLKQFIMPIAVTSVLLQIYWVFCILPYIYKHTYNYEPFIPFSLWQAGDPVRIRTFLPATLALFVILGILLYCFYKKNVRIPIYVLTAWLVYQYLYIGYFRDIYYQTNKYQLANAGYDLISQAKADHDIPHTLYVMDTSDKTDHQNYYMYQFLLNRYQIIPNAPDAAETNAIVFSNAKKDETLLNMGYEVYKLDKNEYLYLRGDQYLYLTSYID